MRKIGGTRMINAALKNQIIDRLQSWQSHALAQNRTFRWVAIASLLAAFYWGLVASDRYVSEAHVIIAPTESGSSTSSVAGMNLGSSTELIAFQLWLRDYLLSVDMMNFLNDRLNLRAHYSDWHRDPLYRNWFENTSLEKFHDYYQSRVSVELDASSGTLVIKAEGFDPEMAHAIADLMVKQGERYMNEMAQHMIEEQVSFLQKQVDVIRERDLQARQLILSFQNKKGVVSPVTEAASIDAVANNLDAQRATLQANRNALLAYLTPNNPSILVLDQQIGAIEKQMKAERARFASPNGRSLNNAADEFQRLQMNATLMDTAYGAAVAALESGRVQAALTMRKVFVLQAPTMPQYPLEPRRLYNTVVFILVMLLIAGIAHLLAAIIRDHKD